MLYSPKPFFFKLGWCLEPNSVKSWAVFNTSKDWGVGMYSLRTCIYWQALFHLSSIVHKVFWHVCKLCVSAFQTRGEFKHITAFLNCIYVLWSWASVWETFQGLPCLCNKCKTRIQIFKSVLLFKNANTFEIQWQHNRDRVASLTFSSLDWIWFTFKSCITSTPGNLQWC